MDGARDTGRTVMRDGCYRAVYEACQQARALVWSRDESMWPRGRDWATANGYTATVMDDTDDVLDRARAAVLATTHAMPTWRVWRDARARTVACDNGCAIAEAMTCSEFWAADWRTLVCEALEEGWVPAQSWVNTVCGRGTWGWRESYLHSRPDVLDRLLKAGRSTSMPLRQRAARPTTGATP